ncbi:putative amidoligase, partial [Leptodontidium sp. 2 PMI_412]
MDVITPHIFSPFEPRQDNLTFGLELEFAIAYIPPNGQNPNPKDPRQVTGIVTGPRKTWIANLRKHVATTLRSAGISAVANSPYSDDPTRGTEPFWSVKHDDTIKGPQLEGHLFLPIEINSPPFYFGSDEPFREIETVCKVMKENYIISCNRSCGVHVHVGNGLQGFRYEAMQNLLAIIWTFEPQIETVHPLHRVNN